MKLKKKRAHSITPLEGIAKRPEKDMMNAPKEKIRPFMGDSSP